MNDEVRAQGATVVALAASLARSLDDASPAFRTPEPYGFEMHDVRCGRIDDVWHLTMQSAARLFPRRRGEAFRAGMSASGWSDRFAPEARSLRRSDAFSQVRDGRRRRPSIAAPGRVG